MPSKKEKVFDNCRVLEQYCKEDVTVLRRACQIFRRNFMEILQIDVFVEEVSVASACNKVPRKKFLKPMLLDYSRLEVILQITVIAK
jgi:hypothetical protein